MNIQLIRMQSGEDVVADVVSQTDDSIVLSNPIVMVPGRDGTVGFAPWSPLLAADVKELTVRLSYTVYISVPNAEVISNYEQIFSPIITPQSAGKIIT